MPSRARSRHTRLAVHRLEDRLTPAIDSVALTGNTVAEFRPGGTPVGTLSAAEAGTGHMFTYALVSGTGSGDNAKFAVAGDKLVTAAALDSTHTPYSVRVRATDETNQTAEMTFTVTASDDLTVALADRKLTVTGTAAADTFFFASDPVEHQLALNGVNLAVEAADVDSIAFNGNGGNDLADLTGSETDSKFIASLDARNKAVGTYGSLSANGYSIVFVAPQVAVHSRNHQDSIAYFDSSDGGDTLVATADYMTVSGTGYFNGVTGFRYAIANYNGTAGKGTAYMTGDNKVGHGTTAGIADNFVTSKSFGNPGHFANHTTVTTISTDDPTFAGTVNTANGFTVANVYCATATGELHISGPDIYGEPTTFVGAPEYAQYSTDPGALYQFRYSGVGFKTVVANAPSPSRMPSDYKAYILGTDGGNHLDDAVISGASNTFVLFGANDYKMAFSGFGVVYVKAGQGADDSATIRVNRFRANGDAKLTLGQQNSAIDSTDQVVRIIGFEQVDMFNFVGHATPGPGRLAVVLTDSPGNDTLNVSSVSVRLTGSGYLFDAGPLRGDDYILAEAVNGGTNTKHVDALVYPALNLQGNWIDDPTAPTT